MLPLSQPRRIFTVTGTGLAFTTASAMRPAFSGSFISAEPSPLDTTLPTLLAAEKRYQQLRDKQNANDGSTSDSADGKTDSKTDGKNVKSGNTADNSRLTLWLGGVVVSAAALALLARKRRQDA